MIGMISDKRGKGHPRTRWLDTSEYQELNTAGLKEAMRDQKTWRTLSHRVAESRTRLNGFQVQAMWGVNFIFRWFKWPLRTSHQCVCQVFRK